MEKPGAERGSFYRRGGGFIPCPAVGFWRIWGSREYAVLYLCIWVCLRYGRIWVWNGSAVSADFGVSPLGAGGDRRKE